MSFLGRKLRGTFQGDIVSDLTDFAFKRLPGIRIKHRVKQNWLKMYNKAGSVLRLEMVINDPTEFKIRKKVWRNGNNVMEWVDMRKGVAYMFRYREVSLAANGRYLDALAEVDDPTDAIQTLDRITTRKQVGSQTHRQGFQSRRATGPSTLSSVIKRPTLQPRFFQPRHPRQTPGLPVSQTHSRTEAPKRQGEPSSSSLPRSRIDRQGSAFPALACHSHGTPRYGRFDSTPRNSISRGLREADFVTENFLCKKRRIDTQRIYPPESTVTL